MLKRKLAAALSFIILSSTFTSAAAFESTTVSQDEQLTDGISDLTLVADEDAFNEIFCQKQSIAPITDVENTANYAYQITMDEAGSGTAWLNFDMNIGEQKYSVEVEGSVSSLSLPSETVIMGDLTGNLNILGMDYIVDACLTKFEGNDDINVGVTITSADYENNDDMKQTLLKFGNLELTESFWDEFYQEVKGISLNEVQAQSASESTNESPVMLSNNVVGKGYAYGQFRPNVPGEGSYEGTGANGQRLGIWIDENVPEVLCLLVSYCDNVKQSDFVNSVIFYEAFVSRYEIGLQETSGDTFIGALHAFNGRNESNLNSYFNPMIKDIYSLLGVPTDSIETLLNVSGDVEYNDGAAYSYFRVELGQFEREKFDTTATGMPVGFCITTNGRNTGTYRAYSYLTYGVETSAGRFIIRTTTASMSVNVGP